MKKQAKLFILTFISAVLLLSLCNCEKTEPTTIEDWVGVWKMDETTVVIQLDQEEPEIITYKTGTTAWSERSSYNPDGVLYGTFTRSTTFGTREHVYEFTLFNDKLMEGNRQSVLNSNIESTVYGLKFRKQ